jgi:ribonuclease E
MSEPSADTDAGPDQTADGGSTDSAPVRRRRRVTLDQHESTPAASAASEASNASSPADTRRDARSDDPPPKQAESPTSSEGAGSADTSSGGRRRRTLGGDATPAASPASEAPAAPTPPPVPPPARRPRIGDSRPATPVGGQGDGQGGDAGRARQGSPANGGSESGGDGSGRKRRRRGGRGRGRGGSGGGSQQQNQQNQQKKSGGQRRQGASGEPVEAIMADETPLELDEAALEARRGKERKGRPVGRYLMCVHVHKGVTHIAVLEGRSLIEHYVSRPSDDISEIHGNIYLGRVQNVLPGMEAAFVDIGTPKNAVLYRGDVTYDLDDMDGDKGQAPPPRARKGRGRMGRRRDEPRIEDLLKARQTILCQVTKNPIAHKGARLSTEVSLPGRFVVLVPNSATYGISKRLSDKERKRLRNILDKVKPKQHGVIVRTAAENVTAEEIERDVRRLLEQWDQINQLAQKSKAPALLFREPELAVRIIREEFNKDYRGVIIDDPKLYEQVRGYMETIAPALADRIQYHDPNTESLPLFERHHVAEQLRKAVDRKVWLPSGGSLIIEHTEALTVIDVNTGKNVGTSNLEETVFRNNLEAAEEIAKQLRLRDIGGIIVIDFIDMEIRKNRDEVVKVFEAALARDKTRTQVSAISDLGLVEMTRKRIGEGLLESVSDVCEHCEGRGLHLRQALIDV